MRLVAKVHSQQMMSMTLQMEMEMMMRFTLQTQHTPLVYKLCVRNDYEHRPLCTSSDYEHSTHRTYIARPMREQRL